MLRAINWSRLPNKRTWSTKSAWKQCRSISSPSFLACLVKAQTCKKIKVRSSHFRSRSLSTKMMNWPATAKTWSLSDTWFSSYGILQNMITCIYASYPIVFSLSSRLTSTLLALFHANKGCSESQKHKSIESAVTSKSTYVCETHTGIR